MAEKNRYNLMPYNRHPEDSSHNETFETAEGILTIVGATKELPVSGYRNFYIEHKQNGRDWLGFTLTTDSDLYREIKEETKIRYRGVDYLVKKISDGHMECEIDLDFLKKTFHETYSSEITLSLLLYRLLPSGWTVNGAVLIHGSPLIELEACTNLDILTAAEEEYRCWFSWNHETKTCTVTSADAVIRTGEYVTDELNLRALSFRGSSVNFCTRLYAYGKGGVSINSVNDGKKYIEDYTYSSKLIVGHFKCDYELPSNILKAAQYELSIRSQPERSYECDVLDLAKQSEEYEFLDFQIHRTVTLIDTRRGIKLDHRIVEYVEYPDEPHRNTVTLARAVRKMAQIKEVIKHSVDEVKVQVAEVNAAMAQNVTEIQANINAVSANVASVNANVSTVVNDIATLNTKTASISSRVNSVETATTSLTTTVASHGAAIGSITTWQTTTYVNDRQETANSLAAINQTASSQGASIESLTTWKNTTYVNDRQNTNEALAAINQTVSSQGASITSLTTWKSTTYASDRQETTQALAAINQTVSNQGASITSLTTWKNETYVCDKQTTAEALAAINQTASSQGASIDALVSWKNTTYVNDRAQTNQSIAAAYAAANEAGAAAGYIVEKTTNGHKVKASIVIEAINNESTAYISADRINFTGFTTFVRPSDLQGGGSVTTINGGLITTETIDVGSIKKSTVTNGSRAVVFDAGIQTSYVRTNDITATGQLNIGATLVSVTSALKVNGKDVLVEDDLSGYATQNWVNAGFSVLTHTHAGTLTFRSANSTFLAAASVGDSAQYVIALAGHGHGNYSLSDHGHSNYAASEHTHAGMATQTWANNTFALTEHTHAGLLDLKSANGTAIVFTLEGDTTQYKAAAVGHGHSNYAASDHTHSEYALSTHGHSNYAASDHSHAGYMCFKSTTGATLNLAKLGTTVAYYNVALANHTHSGYAASDHTHSGMFSFSSTTGASLTMARAGSTTTYTVALANHSHDGYASASHDHIDYLKFFSTIGTNVNVGRITSTLTSYMNLALANHTHSGYVSASDLSGFIVYSSVSGTTFQVTSNGSTTKINVALANHTHSGYAESDHTHTGMFSFGSTTGSNLTMTRAGSTSTYVVALANHTHSGYISSSDVSGHLVYSSVSGTTLVTTSVGSTTKINIALANHTHESVDTTDHMKFKSTAGANVTLTRLGATLNTDYTFALANHTHDVDNTDHMLFGSTTGANITLKKIGAYSNTNYTFSLANHTHSDLEVNYANLLQIVNTNATTGVVNAKYVSYTTYGTSSTVNLSLALWSSSSGTSANTTDFMKFKSTTGANITLTKKGSFSDTDYTFSLANHSHSAYLSDVDLNGKWYVTINGIKYYVKGP